MERKNSKQSFYKYVSLNTLGMLGLSFYILADTFFVARGVGVQGLASLNLAIPIYAFINGIGLMIGMGSATRYSISKSKTIFTHAIYFVLFTMSIFFVIGLLYTKQLAFLLGAKGETLLMTCAYLKVILCFSPMFILNNLMICFVRNDGNPKLSMMAMLIGSLSNIILDYIFIFPLGMGMFGAALATGIAPIISLLLLSHHIIKKKNTFKLYRVKLQFKKFIDISSLGVSSLISEVSSGVVIIVFNYLILGLEGSIGVAAYGVIANIALVIIAVFTGISQGIQPLLSKCYYLENYEEAKIILKYGFRTAIVFAISIYILSFVFAQEIVNAFNSTHNIQLEQIAINGIHIYFTAFVFVGINILSATYFSSIDKPKEAFSISFLRGFIIIIPTSLILSYLFGINGVWITMTISELIVLILSIKLLKER